MGGPGGLEAGSFQRSWRKGVQSISVRLAPHYARGPGIGADDYSCTGGGPSPSMESGVQT